MRAFLVAVNYSDLLALTLPYNRHHFETVHVVTSTADLPNVAPVCEANGAATFATDSFYEGGAKFNKWKALEECLDRFGRHGWTCLMDADVVWPKGVDLERVLRVGKLYTPFRRMCDPVPPAIPPESEWCRYPLHRQEREFAGYSQVFHALDPVLGPPPWHQTSWSHAGGADSFFQMKWAERDKVRPDFNVLHLGPAGVNWMGRASPLADGSVPEGAEERRRAMREMFLTRRRNRNFDHERLPPSST